MSYSVAASIGNMPYATGAGSNGPHLVYAKNANVWWVFWLSSTSTLNAAYWSGSAWTTATSGATFTLPNAHGNEGRNLTVVGVTISTHDVAWFAQGAPSGGSGYAWRAQLGATSVTWGTASSATGGSSAVPVGIGVGLDSSNYVYLQYDSAADTGNEKSTNADTGTSWASGWGGGGSFYSGNGTASRQVCPGAGGYVLFLAGNESGGSDPFDTDIEYLYGNSAAGATGAVFGGGGNIYVGDWCGVLLDTSPTYMVARRNDNSGSPKLECRIGTVASNVISWSSTINLPTSGLTIPAHDSGVALASDGTSKCYLFVIDSSTGNPVKYCTFTKGSTWALGSWGTWTTLESSSATRNAITACPVGDGTNFWVLWTETVTSGSQYSVVSGKLSVGASAHNQATPTRDTFLTRAVLATKTRSTYETRLSALGSHSRDTFRVRAGLSTSSRETFKVFLALRSNSRDTYQTRAVLASRSRSTFLSRVSALASRARGTFLVRAGLASHARDTFLTRLALATRTRDTFKVFLALRSNSRDTFPIRAGLATRTRSTFLTRIAALATRTRDTFKIGVSGLRTLSTWGRDQFVSRAGVRTNARSTFATRLTLARTLARGTFAIRIPTATRARATFVTRLALTTRLRDTFQNRAWLIGRTRDTFQVSHRAMTHARETFVTRLALKTRTRSTFRIFLSLRALARDTFKVNSVVTLYPWHFGLTSVKQRLNMAFSAKPALLFSFSPAKPKLLMTFTRETPVAQPNTSIQVTMTATDVNGNKVLSLASCSVVVTFPDGSTSNYSLSSGVVSNGDGTYTLTYTTKGQGENLEDWTGVDGAGHQAEFHNETPVSF